MGAITTHILDVSSGSQARGVSVLLWQQLENSAWKIIGKGVTDEDGRLGDLLDPDAILQTGNYRLTFETGTYFAELQIEGFYPRVTIEFTVRDATQHYHVPLLLSPFGYSTYRGS